MDPRLEQQGKPPPSAAELSASVKTLEADRRVLFGQAMDQMEEGVGTYGEFFYKAGYKGGGNNAGWDTRILLMNEPVQDPATGKEMYVAITQDGPIGIIPEVVAANHIDKYKEKGSPRGEDNREFPWDPKKAFRELIEKGNKDARDIHHDARGGYTTPTSTRNPNMNASGTLFDNLNLGAHELVPILHPVKDYSRVSMETAKKAIGNSQAKALVPRELDVNLAREKALQAGDLKKQAQELLGFVKALPPKQ